MMNLADVKTYLINYFLHIMYHIHFKFIFNTLNLSSNFKTHFKFTFIFKIRKFLNFLIYSMFNSTILIKII